MKKITLLLLIQIFLITGCEKKQPETEKTPNDTTSTKQTDSIPEKIKLIIPTFLGNETRNYYGENPPSELNILWKTFIGGGHTNMKSASGTIHYGAGWTGQPLLIEENGELFLFQGSYDHNVRKINAETGEVLWKFDCGDAVKGTGTLWYNPESENPDEKLILIQGSRQGVNVSLRSKDIYSLKGISGISGEEFYRVNVENTPSVSRDVDGSALIVNDTAYIGLENGMFIVFNPNPDESYKVNSHYEPEEIFKTKLYTKEELSKHGGQIITEASTCRIGRMLYIASGSGSVAGFNMDKKEITWRFHIGSDLNGSCIATEDSCLLVPVEKQLIPGNGGMLRLDPRKPPEDAVVWYYPTGNLNLNSWQGGVIGSPAVNDRYKTKVGKNLCAFSAMDGYVYVVNYKETEEDVLARGFDGKSLYPKPKLIFKYKIGSSISTPILFKNKLIAAGYGGIYLFEYNENYEFKLLDNLTRTFEATPISYNGKIFIAAKDGYLYCLGGK